jgi:hypothetical protein
MAAGAQTQPITGTIRDSSSNKSLEKAVVSYVETGKTDTLRVLTDAKGRFSINAAPSGEFILVISNVGYQTKGRRYPATMAGEIGLIQLGEKIKELEGIVIEAPPVKVMQDTVEYRASAYPVRKDAVAEDLLKKLPGVEVDAQGNVTAQGQTITKVRVNGKDFFGGDPKMATKNIPADAIDKIQVIDDASDQAKFSGFDDGDRTKIINITIKKDRNQGVFGNVTAGIGTKAPQSNSNEYELYLRAFRFNNNEQMAVLGNANNTNLNTFTQGGASFQGGGGRGGGGGGGSSTSPSNNLTASNPYQTGYNNAKTGGFNYANDFTPHLTLFGSYQYTDTKSTIITQGHTTSLQSPQPYTNTNTTSVTNQVKHSVLLNFGWGIDPHDSLLLKPQYSYTSNNQNSNNSSVYQNLDMQDIGSIDQRYNGKNTSPNLSGTALWMHRFGKPGRTFSLSLTDSPTPTSETDSNYSVQIDPVDTIHQLSLFHTNNYTYSGRFSYTEPLSLKSGLEFSYSYNNSENKSDKNVYGLSPKLEETFVDSLSNNFDNTLITNKFGLTFRHKERKFNYQIGAALQPTELKSNTIFEDSLRHFDQKEWVFVPIGSLAYQFSTTKRLRVFYTGTSVQPSANQLQPVPDVTDQKNISLGNPNLKPEFDHHFVVNYNNFDNISGRSFFFNLNTTVVQQNISNNIQYVAGSADTVKYTTPENVTGYYTAQGYANYSIPFSNRTFILTMASKLAYTNNPLYFDGVRDVNRTWVPTETVKFEMDKGDWLEVIGGGSYSLNSTTYSQTSQSDGLTNSQTESWVLAQSSRVDFLKIFSFRYDLIYTINQGYAGNVGAKPITLLNAILEARFFKQQGVLGLSVNDLFNQNASFSQSAGTGTISQTQTNILNRFFLLSFTYKFAKFKGAQQTGGDFRTMMRGSRGGGGHRGGGPGGDGF